MRAHEFLTERWTKQTVKNYFETNKEAKEFFLSWTQLTLYVYFDVEK